jgi:hypothetical protein
MQPAYLLLLLILLSVIFSYQLQQQQATKLVGRRLATPEYLKINKDGLQVSVMDPKQNKWFFLVIALLLGIVGWLFVSFGWFAALVGLILAYVVNILSDLFLVPKADSRRFLRQIFASMNRRHADYQRDGDKQRTMAMGYLREEFLKHYGQEITKP